MDQVKLIIKKLRKFGFWVLTGLCLVLILALWQTMTSSLASQFSSRKTSIDGAMSQMQTLSSQADLPTASVVNQTKRAIELQSENVYTAWEVFYNHQRGTDRPQDMEQPQGANYHPDANQWPIFDEKYREDFATAGEKRYKSGRYPTIRQEALENYRDNIQEYISQLKVRFDIKRPKEDLSAAAAAGGRNPAEVDIGTLRGYQLEGKVFWRDANFRLLQRRLRWSRLPKTVEVIVAQEDLWVYETLLQAIGKTNGDSSEFNVPIKEIVGIEIAQDAVDAIEKSNERIVSSKELEQYARSLGMEAGSSEAPLDDSAASSSATEEVLTTDDKIMIQLYDKRYVDKEGKPLTAQEINDNPPAVEYKLLPIRMSVIINQRYISDLLVHCANAHMPIEVQQLAINPGQAPPFVLIDPEINLDRPRDHSDTSRQREEELDPIMQKQNSNYLSVLGPEDLELEITGVIYIFNPPDKSKLPGLPETSELGAGEVEEPEPEPEVAARPATVNEPVDEPIDEPIDEPENEPVPEEAAITEDNEPVGEAPVDEAPNPDDEMFE